MRHFGDYCIALLQLDVGVIWSIFLAGCHRLIVISASILYQSFLVSGPVLATVHLWLFGVADVSVKVIHSLRTYAFVIMLGNR